LRRDRDRPSARDYEREPTRDGHTRVWPGRDTDYARLMNTVPKRVATRTGIDASISSHSAAIDGDPLA
jgi:hypothetical protein